MTDNQYDAKQWLNRMYKAAEEIDSIKRTLETIVADMGGVANYSAEFPGKNPKANETKLIRYSQVAAELEKKQENLDREDTRTAAVIEKLSNKKYKIVLRDRYINRLSWRKIAKVNNYSEARLYELHREALEDIYKYIPGRNGNT